MNFQKIYLIQYNINNQMDLNVSNVLKLIENNFDLNNKLK